MSEQQETTEERIAKVREIPLAHAIHTSGDALRSIAGLAALANCASGGVDPQDVQSARDDATIVARLICRRLLAHLDGDFAESLRLHDEGAAYLESAAQNAEKRLLAVRA